ncbi:MAG TPA: trehalase family glycosidase [Opitutaceae bacterium]|jgi:alpha,alpha-trehalase|nr:trehalase family glycosidase [Opitutaceae bacterium]
MRRRRPAACLLLAGLALARSAPGQTFFSYGPLAQAVADQRIFADPKAFVDADPREAPAAILADFERERSAPGFDLRAFVAAHFSIPAVPAASARVPPGLPLAEHIRELWLVLRREPADPPPGSTLIRLPHPYVVPGGRFQEMYYWDSYFTMLGLRADGDPSLVESMTEDFADLERRFGHIPNGNRTYYLSRSQPPFFSLMVNLVPDPPRFRAALAGEYAYWMDRSAPTHHVVAIGAWSLDRYWDQEDVPRPEALLADEIVAGKAAASGRPAPGVYRDLRSAAESGWDFSSRWLRDGRTLAAIETTDIAPVDLNCLLWHLESTLGLRAAAERRRQAIQALCWDPRSGWFQDYDVSAGRPTGRLSLAGVFPLFFGLASPEQARAVAARLRRDFLEPGGLVTTRADTGQQWDWPNGWAPLQWMAIQGLRRYGETALADEIARRWIALNRQVYRRTGKLMEKYNVVDTRLPAGGGEYPGQDGFGWTNGVLAALMPSARRR